MPKHEKDVTEADKKEAKRRIQGGFSVPLEETSGDDSSAPMAQTV